MTCSATDFAGNVGTASFTVTVVEQGTDTTPPVVNVPSDQTLIATSSSGISQSVSEYTWLSSLTASDSVTNSTGTYSQQLVPECTSSTFNLKLWYSVQFYGDPNWFIWAVSQQPTGSYPDAFTNLEFPMGTTTLTCTAIDYAGNTASASFTVTVVEQGADTTPPTVTLKACDPDVQAGYPANADSCQSWALVDFQQLEDLPSTFTNSTADPTGGVVNFYLLASDSHFGSTTPASDPWPGFDYSVTCTGGTHLFDLQTNWSERYQYIARQLPLGTTTVTCFATDFAGNVGSASFTVIVVEPGTDVTPPVITSSCTNMSSPHPCVASNPTIPITNSTGTGHLHYHYPIATDDVDGILTGYVSSSPELDSVICTPPTDSSFPVGVTTVTCTAYDEAGNVGTASFTITVVDTTAAVADTTFPNIVVSENVFVQTTDPTGRNVSFATPSATDDVGVVTLSCNPQTGTFFPIGGTIVTCTATDAAGNMKSDIFVVSVTYSVIADIILPTFTQISNESTSTPKLIFTTLGTKHELVSSHPGVDEPGAF